MRPSISLILLLVCLFSSAQEANYSITSMDMELAKNANAVVRLDEMTVDLLSIKEMEVNLKRVVTVLNKLGNDHTHAAVRYDNSIKVKHLQAVVYDAFGNEIEKFKQKDFNDVSSVGGGTLYSDSRLLYLDYTPVQYPYTLAFEYKTTTPNTATIPSWYFLDDFLASTEKSKYKVVYQSPNLKPEIEERNLDGLEVNRVDGPNSIRYEAKRIFPIKKEILAPGFQKLAPKLMVRTENFHYEGHDAHVRNWEEMGTWTYRKLLEGRSELPEGTKIKARELVKGLTDDLEKAKAIYSYVQQNTRYISVQVGIGSLQPISAIEVDRLKYGDCKGLTNYTQALLEAVGVKSYYTVVEAGRTKVDFEDEFADLRQGNHIILAIPYKEQYYWLDCTSQIHPFGFVGDFTDDRKVLVVKPEGGEIVKTPAYLNEKNYQKTEAQYILNGEGAIEGSAIIKTRGTQYDNRFYLEDQTAQEIDEHYKDYWDNINNLKLMSYQFENNKDEVVFKEEVAIKAGSYGSKSGDRILFVPNSFNRNTYVPKRYRSRKLPFEIQRGFLDEDEFRIELPKDYVVEALPAEKTVTNEFGEYKMKVAYDEASHSVAYQRSLLIKKGYYPKEKYKLYRDFRKAVAGADKAKIVLIKTNP